MILVDSCGWLEVFASSTLGEAYRPALAKADELLVPTVCLVEVGRRLLSWSGEAAVASGVAVMSQATVVPLGATLALEAARLGPATGLPCADSIIYATALHHGAELWTHDGHFRELPGVRFIAPQPGRSAGTPD